MSGVSTSHARKLEPSSSDIDKHDLVGGPFAVIESDPGQAVDKPLNQHLVLTNQFEAYSPRSRVSSVYLIQSSSNCFLLIHGRLTIFAPLASFSASCGVATRPHVLAPRPTPPRRAYGSRISLVTTRAPHTHSLTSSSTAPLHPSTSETPFVHSARTRRAWTPW